MLGDGQWRDEGWQEGPWGGGQWRDEWWGVDMVGAGNGGDRWVMGERQRQDGQWCDREAKWKRLDPPLSRPHGLSD